MTKQIGGDHYQTKWEHWDIIQEYNIGYLEGNATKYICRWRKKNGIQDLEKAKTYVQKLLSGKLEHPFTHVPEDIIEDFCFENEIEYNEQELLVNLLGRWSKTSLMACSELINDMIQQERLIEDVLESHSSAPQPEHDGITMLYYPNGNDNPRGFDPKLDVA